MRDRANAPNIEKGKIAAIMLLLITSIAIVLLGACFTVFSFIRNVSFTVLNAQVHGAVFGMVVTFLGVRYFLSVQKLKIEVYKTTSKFSWSNFKRDRAQKILSKSR